MKTRARHQGFRKPYLILNPVAGTGKPDLVLQQFQAACRRFGWQGEVYQTRGGDDLEAVVRLAIKNGADLILAAGGDGTTSQAASALVRSKTPLAIIPSGTANLLAADLGIPFDLYSAFDFLQAHARIIRLDGMKVGKRHYFLNVSVGISSILMDSTSRSDKRRFGFLAYLAAGFRILSGVQPIRFKLLVDDKKISASASEILICGGGVLGKLVNLIDVQVKPEDGEVDLFIVKMRALPDYLALAFYLLIGRPRSSRRVVYLKATKSLHIDCKKKLIVQADGDVIGSTPITIKVVPAAVSLLVPDQSWREPLLPERLLKSLERKNG